MSAPIRCAVLFPCGRLTVAVEMTREWVDTMLDVISSRISEMGEDHPNLPAMQEAYHHYMGWWLHFMLPANTQEVE